MKEKSNRGFTLIELLVVIAIIGTLSAVVLASLGSARNKGADSQKKSQLKNMPSAAQLYYDLFDNYSAICNYDTAPIRFQSMVNSISGVCTPGATGYRVYTTMQQQNQCSGSSGPDYLCQDAYGNIKMLDNIPAAGTTCPAVCS